MTSVIQNSPAIMAWYREYQPDTPSQVVTVQKSLSTARHKFDTASRPLATLMLTFHPVLMTAIRCYNDRKNDNAGKSAFAHLQILIGNLGI